MSNHKTFGWAIMTTGAILLAGLALLLFVQKYSYAVPTEVGVPGVLLLSMTGLACLIFGVWLVGDEEPDGGSRK